MHKGEYSSKILSIFPPKLRLVHPFLTPSISVCASVSSPFFLLHARASLYCQLIWPCCTAPPVVQAPLLVGLHQTGHSAPLSVRPTGAIWTPIAAISRVMLVETLPSPATTLPSPPTKCEIFFQTGGIPHFHY